MSTPPSQRQLTGRAVLAMLVAFFGVVIGVNVTMAKLAISTLPGTDVDLDRRAARAGRIKTFVEFIHHRITSTCPQTENTRSRAPGTSSRMDEVR